MIRPELSIVIPCYNEIENVDAIVAAVQGEAEAHSYSYEIILIDNGSTDGTRDAIRRICTVNPYVRAILNTRNFGQMRSPTHGIYQARGCAVIGMCADFQDPPAVIGQFVALWRGGAKVVLAQRRAEQGAGPLLKLIRGAGYRVLAAMSDHPPLPNVTGFGLYDREVVDTLKRWNEPEPFFRGMLVESGYPIALVPVERPERARGESKNGFAPLLGFALSGLAASGKSLLRLPIILSLWAFAAAGLLLLASLVLLSATLLGWSVGLAGFGVLLLILGLIGDQVRLLAERTRGMPLVIEEARLNFPPTP